jgi:hypothetical protein
MRSMCLIGPASHRGRKKDEIRVRRRAARLNLPPYGYLYATTAPYPPPRGY